MKRTKRLILYTSYICDRKCAFCVDTYKDKEVKRHHDLDTELRPRIEEAAALYRNTWADLTGGEPSIYPQISDTIRCCARNGLRVRMITHGGHLKEKGLTFLANGVDDFAISIHGTEEQNDAVMQHKGATQAAKEGIAALKEQGDIFRWSGEDGVQGWAYSVNCMMTKTNVPSLEDFAEDVRELEPRMLSFLTVNSGCWEPMPSYSDISAAFQCIYPLLPPIPVRLRYVPFCMVPEELRRHVTTYAQLSYDPFEWDFGSWFRIQPEKAQAYLTLGKQLGIYGRNLDEVLYNTIARMVAQRAGWAQPDKCKECSHRLICDGIHREYEQRYGHDELAPLGGEPIEDPCHYWRRGNVCAPALQAAGA